jgi:hypothetical protein
MTKHDNPKATLIESISPKLWADILYCMYTSRGELWAHLTNERVKEIGIRGRTLKVLFANEKFFHPDIQGMINDGATADGLLRLFQVEEESDEPMHPSQHDMEALWREADAEGPPLRSGKEDADWQRYVTSLFAPLIAPIVSESGKPQSAFVLDMDAPCRLDAETISHALDTVPNIRPLKDTDDQ